MTLFNLVNKGRAFSLIEDKNKTYVLKKMLWSNELIYEEIESSFYSGIQKSENSFPVVLSLVSNGKTLMTRKANISVNKYFYTETSELIYFIQEILNHIKVCYQYANISGIPIDSNSVYIDIDSPVDISNWIEHNIQ